MNLDARLQWILDNLKQPSGDAWNQKALARAVMHSPGDAGGFGPRGRRPSDPRVLLEMS